MEKKCLECNKSFFPKSKKDTWFKQKRFCSGSCGQKFRQKNLSQEEKDRVRSLLISYRRTGSKVSNKSKEKMRIAKLGKKHTEEFKKEKKLFWREWNSKPENKKKIIEAHKKTAVALKGKPQPWNRGENSHLWKGGLTSVKDALRKCFKYVEWHYLCFVRDKFTCQECGDDKGGNLQVHHIKSFSQTFYENNIMTFEEGIICEEFWDIKNGVTLCEICHKKTPNFGRRDYKKIIENKI